MATCIEFPLPQLNVPSLPSSGGGSSSTFGQINTNDTDDTLIPVFTTLVAAGRSRLGLLAVSAHGNAVYWEDISLGPSAVARIHRIPECEREPAVALKDCTVRWPVCLDIPGGETHTQPLLRRKPAYWLHSRHAIQRLASHPHSQYGPSTNPHVKTP